MNRILTASCLLALTLGSAPAVLAGGDKALACHITGISLEGDRYEGHVISVSTKALGAHCSHSGIPDHRPIGVINNALNDCDETDESSRCVIKYATGRACSRGTNAEGPVAQLCD